MLIKSVKKVIDKSESPEQKKTNKKLKNNLLKGFLTKMYKEEHASQNTASKKKNHMFEMPSQKNLIHPKSEIISINLPSGYIRSTTKFGKFDLSS
jgi:hypothetical protein